MPDASQPSPGILVLNKPVGPSSMRAVSIVRRTLGGIKTGHAGTLDPLADGVLVLACGKPATKSIPHFMGTDKRYRTKIDLRAFTATDDTQAEAEPVPVDVPPTEAAIDSVLEKYVGTIMQTPPVFSAIRVNGKRAYAEARAGRAPEMVARYAYRKAADVVSRVETGFVLAADTVASCVGQILGKPRNQEHAEEILRLLSGRRHDVYTGVCLWSVEQKRCLVDVVRTELEMLPLSEEMLGEYLESMKWEGKAGAFGYQDGHDWLSVRSGSESNVVGLPMERLAELLENFNSTAETVNTGSISSPDSSSS